MTVGVKLLRSDAFTVAIPICMWNVSNLYDIERFLAKVSDCVCQTNDGLKRKAGTTALCSVNPVDTSVDSSSFQSVTSPVSTPAVVGQEDMLPPVKRSRNELAESESREVTMHHVFS